MEHMTQERWDTIRGSLSSETVITVVYEPVRSEQEQATLQLELTSPYNSSWRGTGTDGANRWNYTSMWISPFHYGRHGNVVVLKSVKSNGQNDHILGIVTDIRR